MGTFTLQAFNAQPVTPDDNADIVLGGGAITGIDNGALLYIGSGGSLTITTVGGQTVTMINLPNGSYVPIQVRKVFATGTTASSIIALF
jgi:hypothetical protein